ncbi:MAG: glycoside hydrolase family 88 protein [Treponema sp.]|nr:glycoside hydrolase family 88 protein [Treponema sp.]
MNRIKLQFDKEKVIKLMDAVAEKTLRIDLTWDWPCGVGFYGITRAAEALGNENYTGKLSAWVDEYMTLGLPDMTVNTSSMGHTLLYLYQKTGQQKYLDPLREILRWLQTKAVRFGNNVLQHVVSSKNDFPEQAWADTLFMAAYLMLRSGIEFGDQALIDDAMNQYYWHIKYLQNPSTGMWYHGYDNIAGNHMSGFYWARANAWAAYTISAAMKILPKPYLYPVWAGMVASLRDQLSSIKFLQTDEGLWRTILDDDESYGEVSATAGLTAAMLNNDNPLHTKYAQKAFDGVLHNITEDGRVLNVSGGTAVMNDREGYRNIPKEWVQGWGQGLALALMSIALKSETNAYNV